MKLKLVFSLTALIFVICAFGQRATIDLTFTAVNNGVYVQLDSIKVMNRTHAGETMLYWPDTTLTLDITLGDLLLYIGYTSGYPVGVPDFNHESIQFHLFQNYPNPVHDQCNISMYIPEKGTVNILITDIHGRLVNNVNEQFDAGYHDFLFIPGVEKFYFLSVRWNGINLSRKILTTGSNLGKSCRLDYTGSVNKNHNVKASQLKKDLILQQSGILDASTENETYTFQFATNIPCPGTQWVEYEGQIYNTVQIYSQCWMKENLNVWILIPGGLNQEDNGFIEKYCYDNNPDSCDKYGGLYQWSEMMQYTTQQGPQGICPPDWHLPTDEEWKVLEGSVDSQYGIGDYHWNFVDSRGFDAGTNLKTTSGWYENGNGIDLFGFSGLPGGYRGYDYYTYNIGIQGVWWASSEYGSSNAWNRNLVNLMPEVCRYNFFYKEAGCSVRCLRNY